MSPTSQPLQGISQVDPVGDRRASALLGRRRSAAWPMDRAGPMENAQSAFPTGPWTAPRARRPQRSTGPCRRVRERSRASKMTTLMEGDARMR